MRSLLILALLHAAHAGAAAAATPAAQPTSMPAPAGSAPPAPSPATPEAPAPGTAVPQEQAPAQTQEPATAPDAEQEDAAEEAAAPALPADAPTASAEPEPIRDPEAQRLVSGAPLFNENVAVHVVQKKRFADAGKHEVVLFPAVVQINGKYTTHVGTALQYVYHLQENLALQVAGQYHWRTSESGFVEELRDKTASQGLAASSLLLEWGATAGVEVTPFYGKFAFYDGILGQFSLVLSGGAGVGSTRVLLRPGLDREVGEGGGTEFVPARYSDTGQRFLGTVGGGFRVQLGKRFALRLEARDLLFTARVDRVGGCNLADIDALILANQEGTPFDQVDVSGSCNEGQFDGEQAGTSWDLRDDLGLARGLIAEPSSDVLNIVGFYAGFSILF